MWRLILFAYLHTSSGLCFASPGKLWKLSDFILWPFAGATWYCRPRKPAKRSEPGCVKPINTECYLMLFLRFLTNFFSVSESYFTWFRPTFGSENDSEKVRKMSKINRFPATSKKDQQKIAIHRELRHWSAPETLVHFFISSLSSVRNMEARSLFLVNFFWNFESDLTRISSNFKVRSGKTTSPY